MQRLCQCSGSASRAPVVVEEEGVEEGEEELRRLPLSKLIDLAREAGAEKQELDAAIDSQSPRSAVAELVAISEEWEPSPGSARQMRPAVAAEAHSRFEPLPEPQPQEQLVVPTGHSFCCDYSCGFTAISFEEVAAHERAECPRRPDAAVASSTVNTSPLPSISLPGGAAVAYSCGNDCGFTAISFEEVAEHERAECPRRPDAAVASSTVNTSPLPSISLTPDEGVLGCEKNWADMNQQEREATIALGWSDSSWEAGDEVPMRKPWNVLSDEQVAAALLLGFDELDFDKHDQSGPMQPEAVPAARGNSPPTHKAQETDSSQHDTQRWRLSPAKTESPSPRETGLVLSSPKGGPDQLVEVLGKEKEWENMNEGEQNAVLKLGWTADSWNDGDSSPFKISWEHLGPSRQQDAALLGFDHLAFGASGAQECEEALEDPIPEEDLEHAKTDDHGSQIEPNDDPQTEELGRVPVDAEVTAQAEEERRGPTFPFQVGDKLQVYSKSAGNWVDAEVEKLERDDHVRVIYNRAGREMRKTPRICDLRVLVEVHDYSPWGKEFIEIEGEQMLAVAEMERGDIAYPRKDRSVCLPEGMFLAKIGDQEVKNGDHGRTRQLLQEATSGPRPLRMVFVPPSSVS